jgi:hypothetical protein
MTRLIFLSCRGPTHTPRRAVLHRNRHGSAAVPRIGERAGLAQRPGSGLVDWWADAAAPLSRYFHAQRHVAATQTSEQITGRCSIAVLRSQVVVNVEATLRAKHRHTHTAADTVAA